MPVLGNFPAQQMKPLEVEQKLRNDGHILRSENESRWHAVVAPIELVATIHVARVESMWRMLVP